MIPENKRNLDWVQREPQSDLTWIEAPRLSNWLLASLSRMFAGRYVVDTTSQSAPVVGHSLAYFAQDALE